MTKKAKGKKPAPDQARLLDIDNKETLVEEEKYDSVPYESYSYPQTQPEHLAAIASLFNLTPAKFEKCRVLELGCAGGGNLIPFALAWPKAQCLGIDLSKEQVAQANKQKKDLGLKNVEFRQGDISKLGKDIGKFDYIICHGVFSWVPQKVRDAIFESCRNHLNDTGIAVISYNVLPGWAAVQSLRAMMLYHTRNFKEPAQQIHEARALLHFLYENAPQANESYRQIIDRERQILNNTNDSYIFHEHLENENHQYYLHEFVEMAQAHDLAYVGDSSLTTMYIGNFSKKVQETLVKINDIVRQEQYIDFLINRRFRHSILTKKENAAKIKRTLRPDSIFDYYIHPLYQPDSKDPNKFAKKGGTETMQAHDKITAKLLTKLVELGGSCVKADTVIRAIAKEDGLKDDSALRQIFAKNGLMLTLQGFLALYTAPFPHVQDISKKPKAFALARYQAGLNVPKVTTMRRESVAIDPYTRKLISHLDGKSDLSALVKKLKEDVKRGELHVQKDKKPVTDDKELEKILTGHTEATLKKLAGFALLEA